MMRPAKIALVLLGAVALIGGIWWLIRLVAGAGYGPSFLISGGIFLLVFAAISLRWMHETAAALLGAVAIWMLHYIGGRLFPALRLLTFEESMSYVDWNVIFLIMGMMIFIAILSETGIFGWLAFRAFRWSGGNAWLLGMALVVLTGVLSAFLNDVTAVLLLVPLSIQIAQTVGITPLAFIIPEVLASNIGGAATIIGDPPSTIVGSHIGLGFVEYIINMAPVACFCMLVLCAITTLLYRGDYMGAREQLSASLVKQLEAGSRIRDHALLRKGGLIGGMTMLLFFMGDWFGLPPSVIALSGAAVLIAWVRPDMHRMLREVDWTTLVFFIGIFIVVGSLESSGVIGWLAAMIQRLAGEDVSLATILMIWIPGIASGIVANIPFTVAALPIADLLTEAIPEAGQNVLYWSLILGADLGGNSTYLGSAPNIVAVGLLAQAGYPLSFGRFMRDGVPVTILTLLVATGWLIIRF